MYRVYGSSYWWGIDDGDSLDDLLLVRLGSRSIQIANDGGHSRLVAHGGSEVNWLLWVILWEAVKRMSAHDMQNICTGKRILTFPR